MIIAADYSFNGGKEFISKYHADLLEEVYDVIAHVNAASHKTKTSKEKTMPGEVLYSPRALNAAFKSNFEKKQGWKNCKVKCDYSNEYYRPDYKPAPLKKGAFRDMDFVKNKLGVEVQFGKYAFMVYNVCAKMTIFKNLGHIDAGIEIVPMWRFAHYMSTGVSYFQQFAWDLQARGVSNIDIPVLIIGIDA